MSQQDDNKAVVGRWFTEFWGKSNRVMDVVCFVDNIGDPCHRVVKKDGSLSGYRWGARRKRALLARERHHEEFGPVS